MASFAGEMAMQVLVFSLGILHRARYAWPEWGPRPAPPPPQLKTGFGRVCEREWVLKKERISDEHTVLVELQGVQLLDDIQVGVPLGFLH